MGTSTTTDQRPGYHGLRPAAEKPPAAWVSTPAAATDTSLYIDGHPVMQAWEAPYMGALAAAAAANGGRVLEVGFGMGLSAAALQRHPVAEHLIVEANADVFARLQAFAARAARPVTPLGPALWQHALDAVPDASLDGVLYDTYPLSAEEQHTHQFEFIARAYEKLRPGGVLTYCNLTSLGVLRPRYDTWAALFEETQLPHLLRAGFARENLSYKVFEVTPPASCEYYQLRTALVPICVKAGGSSPRAAPSMIQSRTEAAQHQRSNGSKSHKPSEHANGNGSQPEGVHDLSPAPSGNGHGPSKANGNYTRAKDSAAQAGAHRDERISIALERRKKELALETAEVEAQLKAVSLRKTDRQGTVVPPRRVNAWTQWGTLREIVIGVADNACYIPEQPGSKPTVNTEGGSGATAENNDGAGRVIDTELSWPRGRKKQEVIDAANKQLDNLADVFRSRGISVLRPRRDIDYALPIKTPFFDVPHQYCNTCGRDSLITIGNIVLEAAMSRRDRYFETVAYRDIIADLHRGDANMLWKAAPKPVLADTSYNEQWWALDTAERYERMYAFEFCINEDEPLFDAADITRCGKDVFVQLSMTTNHAGIDWLTRELRPHGIRVHTLRFPYDLAPSHIDCTFVPLRPGLVLTNPDRPCMKEDLALFKNNGWRFIEAPPPVNPVRPWASQSSKWLSMNVLVIAPDVVVVEEQESAMHDLLRKEGFEVIAVPFRDVYEFGGGLHCATWDILRDDTMEDHFPVQ